MGLDIVQIRSLKKSDRAEWLRMRFTLWPGEEAALVEEVDRFYSGTLLEPQAVLVAEESGALIGFVELSIRPHAEGCHTQRVGYLEAWYVDVQARRRGIGRALVTGAEDWARSQMCTEFASDSEIGNEISAQAHKAIGFEEVETIRCFRRKL
jgi:aminoglycoside 6'-N-acetyltransferase I